MSYTLTEAGWPRPRVAGLPVPWVAPTENFGEVNTGRQLASVGGAVCQVCGLGFAYDEDAFGFTWIEPANLASSRLEHGDYLSKLSGYHPGDMVTLLDGAVLHHRCARLTAAMCPAVRDGKDRICVRVPSNDADPREVGGKLVPTYPAGDVEYVPWPAPRRSA